MRQPCGHVRGITHMTTFFKVLQPGTKSIQCFTAPQCHHTVLCKLWVSHSNCGFARSLANILPKLILDIFLVTGVQSPLGYPCERPAYQCKSSLGR
eukprot:5069744-Lingulodinium_polyedra.AAC.1